MSEEEKGFVIKDRRLFKPEDEPLNQEKIKEEQPEENKPEAPPSEAQPEQVKPAEQASPEQVEPEQAQPEQSQQAAQAAPEQEEGSSSTDSSTPTDSDDCDDTFTGGQMPEINFSTFVFSLSSSALLHLGEMPDPSTNQLSTNLPLAKQTIDILGILQEKTKGNLEDEEKELLKNLLYELRMRYVTKCKEK